MQLPLILLLLLMVERRRRKDSGSFNKWAMMEKWSAYNTCLRTDVLVENNQL